MPQPPPHIGIDSLSKVLASGSSVSERSPYCLSRGPKMAVGCHDAGRVGLSFSVCPAWTVQRVPLMWVYLAPG